MSAVSQAVVQKNLPAGVEPGQKVCSLKPGEAELVLREAWGGSGAIGWCNRAMGQAGKMLGRTCGEAGFFSQALDDSRMEGSVGSTCENCDC